MTAALGFVALWWCLTGLDHGWPMVETWAPLVVSLAAVVGWWLEGERADRRDARSMGRHHQALTALNKETKP